MAATSATADPRRVRRMERSGGPRATLLLRLIWAEARRSHAIWILPMLVAAGVWFALEYSQVDLLFWDQVSANIALTFVLIGPVCSAWGAWLAGRESRHQLTELASAGPTTSIRRDVVAFGTPVIGALVAYAIIALIVGGYTATYATWAGPAWSVILFGALVSAVMALCGAVFGRIWPTRISPFIAFAIPLFYTTLTFSYFKSWNGQRWLAPYAYISDWEQHPGNFLYQTPDSLYRSTLLGGVLVASAAVLLMLGLMALLRQAPIGAAISGAMVVVLLLSGRAMTMPDVREVPSASYSGRQPVVNPPMACAGEVVTTCLHQVYEPELEEAAAKVDAMFALIAGLPGVPERIEQRADLKSTDAVLRFDQVWTFNVMPDYSASYDLLVPVLSTGPDIREGGELTAPQHVIARWLTSQSGDNSYFYYASAPAEIENPFEQAAEQRRLNDGTSIVEVSEAEAIAYQEALADYNQQVREAADRFAALPFEEQRAWLEANWDALRVGDLTLEDLP